MLDLQIAFGAVSRIHVHLALFLASCLWILLCVRRGWRRILYAPFLAFGLLALARSILTVGINPDAAEQLHCGWMMAQGMAPYRDFWQHHSPLLPLVLAAGIEHLDPQTTLYPAARAGAMILTGAIALMGWRIAREVWREKASAGAYAVVLSAAAVLGNFWVLRADLPMVLCQLLGIHACLRIARGRRGASFAAGLFLALALGFSVKQLFFLVLPPAALALRGDRGRRLGRGLAAYGAGLAAGFLPLVGYLASQDLFGEFYEWVVGFNATRVVVAASFPAAVALAAVAGILAAREALRRRDVPTRVLLLAFGLACAASMLSVATAFRYYLQLWIVLCAVLASRADGPAIAERLVPAGWRRGRTAAAAAVLGLVLTLLFAPDIEELRKESSRSFREDRAMIASLHRLTRGDTCLIFIPDHPVFARDATRLYSGWQYEFAGTSEKVREDARAGGVLDRILEAPPSVVAFDRGGVWMPEALRRRGFLSRDEQEEFARFLRGRYVVRRIGPSQFYVRRDKASTR